MSDATSVVSLGGVILYHFGQNTLGIDLKAQEVRLNNTYIPIHGSKPKILAFLCERRGSVVTKEMFLEHLYEDGQDTIVPDSKIIDVFMCGIKSAIKKAMGTHPSFIATVWGRGYVLHADTPAVALMRELQDVTTVPVLPEYREKVVSELRELNAFLELSITPRWVPKMKATVLKAIQIGVMTPQEAFTVYQLSGREYQMWRNQFEQRGLRGLRAVAK